MVAIAKRPRPIPAGFVDAEAVRKELRIHSTTWIRRLRDTGITLYKHPGDRRLRLLRVEDADFLRTPQPSEPRPMPSRAGRKAVAA